MKRLRIHSRSSKRRKTLDFGKLGSKMGRSIGSGLGRRVGSLMGRELAEKYLPGITWKLAGSLFPGIPMETMLTDFLFSLKQKKKTGRLHKKNKPKPRPR